MGIVLACTKRPASPPGGGEAGAGSRSDSQQVALGRGQTLLGRIVQVVGEHGLLLLVAADEGGVDGPAWRVGAVPGAAVPEVAVEHPAGGRGPGCGAAGSASASRGTWPQRCDPGTTRVAPFSGVKSSSIQIELVIWYSPGA